MILIPLLLRNPSNWLIYSLEGAMGTAIGGWIGYQIAIKAHEAVLERFASAQEIESGKKLMDRYGVLAVFIGGVTPIPDFLLAYLAGLTKMSCIPFLLSDGVARLLRSLLVSWCMFSLGYVVDIERWGTVISLIMIALLLFRWAKNEKKAKSS